MVTSSNEKVELAAYQLIYVAQTWSTQRKDNRALREGPISWEAFSREFPDRFFPREKIKAKVEDFINHYQGGMSVLEYSLKFTKFSKYASSSPRDEMNHFVTGVSDDLVEKCHSAMLHDNIDISHLMVYSQQL